MNFVKTTAPISIDNLKKYFIDKNTFFIIDYNNSTLKGKKLLVYLSNLEIPSDIDFSGSSDTDFFEILKEYFNLQSLCKISFLEKAAIAVLKEKSKITNTDFFKTFIESNENVIDEWLSKIYSLSLYNMYIVDIPEFKKFATDHTIDDSDSLDGVNFVSLLKHPDVYDLYQSVDHSKVKFYKKYFNEYMFKGANMYSFWANENNPLFILTVSIAEGTLTGSNYVSAIKETIKEIENASPV